MALSNINVLLHQQQQKNWPYDFGLTTRTIFGKYAQLLMRIS